MTVRSTIACALLLLAACTPSDRELFPGSDASTGFDAGVDAGPSACLNGAAVCDGCAPACTGCASCGVACAPGASCRVALREPVTGTLSCDDAPVCGQPAGAFEYCRGDQPECVVTLTAAGTASCLYGRCNFTCEVPCELECPSGDCAIRCVSPPCSFRSCPVAVMSCPLGGLSCGGSCSGL
ncbi:MAG: hypothetical protein AB7S26_03355 [Sandaracinaceae bacterium]